MSWAAILLGDTRQRWAELLYLSVLRSSFSSFWRNGASFIYSNATCNSTLGITMKKYITKSIFLHHLICHDNFWLYQCHFVARGCMSLTERLLSHPCRYLYRKFKKETPYAEIEGEGENIITVQSWDILVCLGEGFLHERYLCSDAVASNREGLLVISWRSKNLGWRRVLGDDLVTLKRMGAVAVGSRGVQKPLRSLII